MRELFRSQSAVCLCLCALVFLRFWRKPPECRVVFVVCRSNGGVRVSCTDCCSILHECVTARVSPGTYSSTSWNVVLPQPTKDLSAVLSAVRYLP